jgi:hypothetical protein
VSSFHFLNERADLERLCCSDGMSSANMKQSLCFDMYHSICTTNTFNRMFATLKPGPGRHVFKRIPQRQEKCIYISIEN